MIYCSQCGHPNDDNAYQCVSCSEVIRRVADPVSQGDAAPVPSHLVWSILVTIFCCQIAGIPAIVYSAISMSKSGSGDHREARDASRTAAIWCWVAFGIGLLVYVPYAILVGFGVMAEVANGP